MVISSSGDQLRPCDVLITNSWQTAYILNDLPRNAQSRVYLLQDYEPLFYPTGEDYIAVEQSYRLGLRHISYGPWVKRRVEQELGVGADWIPFFANKSTYYLDPEVRRATDRLVVLMRPEIPQYLAELAAEAVALFVNETGFPGTVEFFGSDVRLNLPFPHAWHGEMAADRLAALFREATLGVALSEANPTTEAFEMMACGLPIVDIDYNEKHISYGGYDTVRLARPEPQALADEIARLFHDQEARNLLASNAQRFAAQMPDEAIVGALLEQLLKSYLSPESEPTGEQVAQPVPTWRSGPEPAEAIDAEDLNAAKFSALIAH
jgi:hypothetical protein